MVEEDGALCGGAALCEEAADQEAAATKIVTARPKSRRAGQKGSQGPNIRRFVNVYVNGDDIRFLQNLETALKKATRFPSYRRLPGHLTDNQARSCHR